ncbi:hypothetical protein GCM10009022_22710 [Vreelandella titanicae]
MLFDEIGEPVFGHRFYLHVGMDRLEGGGQPPKRHLRKQQRCRYAQPASRGIKAISGRRYRFGHLTHGSLNACEQQLAGFVQLEAAVTSFEEPNA